MSGAQFDPSLPPPTHAGRKMGGALKKSEQEKNAHFLSSFHYFPLAAERNTEKQRISYYCSKKRYLTGISLCLGKEQKTKVLQHECNITLAQFPISYTTMHFLGPDKPKCSRTTFPFPLCSVRSTGVNPRFLFLFFRRTAPSISRAVLSATVNPSPPLLRSAGPFFSPGGIPAPDVFP